MKWLIRAQACDWKLKHVGKLYESYWMMETIDKSVAVKAPLWWPSKGRACPDRCMQYTVWSCSKGVTGNRNLLGPFCIFHAVFKKKVAFWSEAEAGWCQQEPSFNTFVDFQRLASFNDTSHGTDPRTHFNSFPWSCTGHMDLYVLVYSRRFTLWASGLSYPPHELMNQFWVLKLQFKEAGLQHISLLGTITAWRNLKVSVMAECDL